MRKKKSTPPRSKVSSFKHDISPVIKDYKKLVASATSCQGIWGFDDPSHLTLDASGGVVSVASWKDSVALLSFKSGIKKASLVAKSKGGTVAAIPSGTSYLADSAIKINGNLPYSILVLAKPDNYTSQMAIAGAPIGSLGNNIRIESLTGNKMPLMRNVRGAGLPNIVVPDTSVYVAFLATFDGTTTKAINLTAGSGTSSVEASSTMALDFLLGSENLYPFAGEVDLVALFNKDVTSDALLYEYIKYFTEMRLAKI